MFRIQKNLKRHQAYLLSLLFVFSFVCKFMHNSQATPLPLQSTHHNESMQSMHCHSDLNTPSDEKKHALNCCESSSSCHQKSLLTQHHSIDQVNQVFIVLPVPDLVSQWTSVQYEQTYYPRATDYGSSRPRPHLLNCTQLI